ncbi:DUF1801 domain-containing protein [Patescibacteria group bacterium]
MNIKVKKYIEKQEEPKKTLLEKSRKLILNTIPDCKEEFNWGVPVYDGGKYYIAAMKTRIHIGFAISGLSKKEVEEFEGTGKTMKHIKVHSIDEFDTQRLTRLIRLVDAKADLPHDHS